MYPTSLPSLQPHVDLSFSSVLFICSPSLFIFLFFSDTRNHVEILPAEVDSGAATSRDLRDAKLRIKTHF